MGFDDRDNVDRRSGSDTRGLFVMVAEDTRGVDARLFCRDSELYFT